MSALNAPHFHDDDKAGGYLETIRWPRGPVCPHCGSTAKQYKLGGRAHRRGLWKCSDCREQLSVTVGTVFELCQRRSILRSKRCTMAAVEKNVSSSDELNALTKAEVNGQVITDSLFP